MGRTEGVMRPVRPEPWTNDSPQSRARKASPRPLENSREFRGL